MAIDTQKLIPHASKGQKISAKSVENIGIIATKLIDVDTILKGSLLSVSYTHLTLPTILLV